MAVPCYYGPQKCIIEFEKFFVLGDEYLERLEGKIRKGLFFMLKYSKITVWLNLVVQSLEEPFEDD